MTNKLDVVVTELVEDAMHRMLKMTAEESVRGLSYDAKKLVEAELQRRVQQIFNEDEEIRNKLRDVVLAIVSSYRVASPEERARSRY